MSLNSFEYEIQSGRFRLIYTPICRTENRKEAIDKAIRECIKNEVLADFLRKHKVEVEHMNIYEYDEAEHKAMERVEAIESVVENMIRKNLPKDLIISVTEIKESEYEKIHQDIKKEAGYIDIYEDGEVEHKVVERAEAIAEGVATGQVYERIQIIGRKIEKSKSLDQIAAELECEVQEIVILYNIIKQLGTNCEPHVIMEEISNYGKE